MPETERSRWHNCAPFFFTSNLMWNFHQAWCLCQVWWDLGKNITITFHKYHHYITNIHKISTVKLSLEYKCKSNITNKYWYKKYGILLQETKARCTIKVISLMYHLIMTKMSSYIHKNYSKITITSFWYHHNNIMMWPWWPWYTIIMSSVLKIEAVRLSWVHLQE